MQILEYINFMKTWQNAVRERIVNFILIQISPMFKNLFYIYARISPIYLLYANLFLPLFEMDETINDARSAPVAALDYGKHVNGRFCQG